MTCGTHTITYDHRGRMVSKRITENDGTNSPFSILHSTFVWDDWNIIRGIQVLGIRDQGSGGTLTTNDYQLITDNIWGLDLDGTLHGAGGVGGLLAVVRSDCAVTNSAFCILHSALYLPTYDANGNVSEYVTTNGEIVAHYDYSPFGEILVQSGDLADTFTHRFSTKPWCPVTGLYEYQMRKYRPEIGRWMSRDPIGEKQVLIFRKQQYQAHIDDEENISVDATDYSFNRNCPLCLIDVFGLYDVAPCKIEIFLGHNTKSKKQKWGWVPKTISTGTLGAASAHACYSDKISISPNRVASGSSGTISILDAAKEADRAFETAKDKWIDKICKSSSKDEKCCKEVTVVIVCKFGLDWLGKAAVPGGICGKKFTRRCDE